MKCLDNDCNQEALPGEAYCAVHRYWSSPGPGHSGGGGGGTTPSDPPIIITGGSITIEFDPNQLTPAGAGKFSNQSKKITRVEITGDGINFAQDTPTGKVTITIHYRDP